MIKEVKKLQIITCLEVIIKHPIEEIGEVPLYVSKIKNQGTYIFSIPYHNWSYLKENGKEINLIHAPSGFYHPQYKPHLITAMNQSIDIIENDKIKL